MIPYFGYIMCPHSFSVWYDRCLFGQYISVSLSLITLLVGMPNVLWYAALLFLVAFQHNDTTVCMWCFHTVKTSLFLSLAGIIDFDFGIMDVQVIDVFFSSKSLESKPLAFIWTNVGRTTTFSQKIFKSCRLAFLTWRGCMYINFGENMSITTSTNAIPSFSLLYFDISIKSTSHWSSMLRAMNAFYWNMSKHLFVDCGFFYLQLFLNLVFTQNLFSFLSLQILRSQKLPALTGL